MNIATQRLLIFSQCGGVQRRGIAQCSVFVNQFPDAFQEAVRPFHARLLPFQGHVGRRGKHHEQTHGVRTVTLNHHLRIDAVVFRLGHLAHAGIDQFMTFGVFRLNDTAFLVALDDRINRRNPVTFAISTDVIERICQYHALTQQLFCWFVRVHHACIAHQFVEEAEVEQVHDGVFDAADIDINRQPVVCRIGIEHTVLILRAGVARIVPG